MPDFRTTLPKTVGWRNTAAGGSFTTTNKVGPDTSVDPQEDMHERPTGIQTVVGAGYNISLQIEDPGLYAALKSAMLNNELYDFIINYGGNHSLTLQGGGFRVSKNKPAGPGSFDSFTIEGTVYGIEPGDVLTFNPVIGTNL